MKTFLLALLYLVLLVPALSAADKVDYLRDIKPILTKHCYACHGADKQKAGLRLATAARAQKGSKKGPVIVVGKAKDSKLVKALHGAGGLTKMPPRDPRLTPQQIALLTAWIDAGAKAPPGEVEQPATNKGKHW